MVISSMKSATVGGSQQLYLRLHWNDRWVLPKVVSLTLLSETKCIMLMMESPHGTAWGFMHKHGTAQWCIVVII